MGKPKFRFSIKALHQGLFGFRAPSSKTMTWVCIQQTKTDSFREVYKSFNTVYYTTTSSSASMDLCSRLQDETNPPETTQILSASSSRPSAAEDSFTTTSSSSNLSSDSSDEIHSVDPIIKGYISSKRFFFSPCTTKSIMGEASESEEAKDKMGLAEIECSGDGWIETDEEDQREEARGECMILETGFCKESFTMALASSDPYMDFRVSMGEMVEAHGLREWACLQELLHCYLTLNDKKTHKIIVMAFIDLLMGLITGEANNDSSNSCKDRCFPLPLCSDV